MNAWCRLVAFLRREAQEPTRSVETYRTATAPSAPIEWPKPAPPYELTDEIGIVIRYTPSTP